TDPCQRKTENLKNGHRDREREQPEQQSLGALPTNVPTSGLHDSRLPAATVPAAGRFDSETPARIYTYACNFSKALMRGEQADQRRREVASLISVRQASSSPATKWSWSSGTLARSTYEHSAG